MDWQEPYTTSDTTPTQRKPFDSRYLAIALKVPEPLYPKGGSVWRAIPGSVCLSVSPFGHEGCGRSLQGCEMSWRSSITSPEGDPRHWESVVSPDYPGRLHPFVAWSGRTDHVGTIAYLWYVRNVQIVGEHHRPYRQDSVIRWPNIKKEHELKVEKEEEKKKKEKKIIL